MIIAAHLWKPSHVCVEDIRYEPDAREGVSCTLLYAYITIILVLLDAKCHTFANVFRIFLAVHTGDQIAKIEKIARELNKLAKRA